MTAEALHGERNKLRPAMSISINFIKLWLRYEPIRAFFRFGVSWFVLLCECVCVWRYLKLGDTRCVQMSRATRSTTNANCAVFNLAHRSHTREIYCVYECFITVLLCAPNVTVPPCRCPLQYLSSFCHCIILPRCKVVAASEEFERAPVS